MSGFSLEERGMVNKEQECMVGLSCFQKGRCVTILKGVMTVIDVPHGNIDLARMDGRRDPPNKSTWHADMIKNNL